VNYLGKVSGKKSIHPKNKQQKKNKKKRNQKKKKKRQPGKSQQPRKVISRIRMEKHEKTADQEKDEMRGGRNSKKRSGVPFRSDPG